MKKLFRGFSMIILLIASFAMFSMTSCTERVPPGYKGMVQTPNGLTGDVLEPGNHTCFNRDRMILIENAETNYKSHMAVLCVDDLNFKFDVNTLARLRTSEGDAMYGKQMKNILDRQGGKIKWGNSIGVIEFNTLYKTYIAPKVDAIARSVVSKYKTTQIRENRDKIEKEITTRIMKVCENTPIEVINVVTSNFDYPDVITKAQEKAKEREIALKEEDAKLALELKKIANRKKVSEEEKIVKMKEAEAIAIYNRIVGNSLSPAYLKMCAIDNQKILYSTKGVQKVIVPEGSTPFISQ